MAREIKLGNRMVGDGHPAYVIAEIGINHNGDIDITKQMIDAAVHAGADAVKFQKRTPEVSTPEAQKTQMRETPWGYITYLVPRDRPPLQREGHCLDGIGVGRTRGGLHGEVRHARLQSSVRIAD
jgi:N-acetylneuraminate synthase